MIKFLISLIKQIIFGFVILYGYNMIAINFNLVMPINLFTVFSVSFLGFPALFSLILFYVFVF